MEGRYARPSGCATGGRSKMVSLRKRGSRVYCIGGRGVTLKGVLAGWRVEKESGVGGVERNCISG